MSFQSARHLLNPRKYRYYLHQSIFYPNVFRAVDKLVLLAIKASPIARYTCRLSVPFQPTGKPIAINYHLYLTLSSLIS